MELARPFRPLRVVSAISRLVGLLDATKRRQLNARPCAVAAGVFPTAVSAARNGSTSIRGPRPGHGTAVLKQRGRRCPFDWPRGAHGALFSAPWRAGRDRAFVVCAVALAALAAGCGDGRAAAARPPRPTSERALAEAPAPWRGSTSGAMPRGRRHQSVSRQLAALRGYPVVVNKWASWCGPCRFEFPFFQRQVTKRGKQVAFLAVNSEDARDPAQKFLEEIPVPYPSFFDPDSDIARLLGRSAPSPSRPSTTGAASRSTPSRAATPPRPRWRTTSGSTRSRAPGRARQE